MLKFLKKILGLNKEKVQEQTLPEPAFTHEEFTQPKFHRFDQEPVLALKDEKLVMIIEHQFQSVPSWVEWDQDRNTITIAHVNGDTDEAPLELKQEYISQLGEQHKILLISNDNDQKIMHTVRFVMR